MVWIGDRSYSIYLWHWPVLQITKELGLLKNSIGVACAIGVSVALAGFSYRYIEEPFWKGRYSGISRITITSAALVLVSVSIGVSNTSHMPVPLADRQSDSSKYNPRFDLPAIYAGERECDSWFNSAEIKPCLLAGENSEKTVMLIGDSVGAQWVSALPQIFSPASWRSIVLTKSACPIIDENYYYDAVGDVYRICAEWRKAAIEYIRQTRPEILIIGSSSHYDFTDEQWIGGQVRVLDQLHEFAGKIVILPGTPMLTFDDPRCMSSSSTTASIDVRSNCSHFVADPKIGLVAELLSRAARNYENVQVVDLIDIVCPRKRCERTNAFGVVVYRDRRHLTNKFVLSQVPEIRRRMSWLDEGPILVEQATAVESPQ